MLHLLLYYASQLARAQSEIYRGRSTTIGDPAKCSINEEIWITDYFGQAK